ncbi:serine protease FAM111A-like [Xyrauchen texanus]|uniref:serine protease FAM111A-like n=1 Tax=Xyrauchen texanus TaxID=154827 RepID=UPI0022420AC8|nr:serine protease FAM111A-like [Xyrauchen texanus]
MHFSMSLPWMDHSSQKKEEEGSSTSHHAVQQSPERERHTFTFKYKDKSYIVACDKSQTVIDALNDNGSFKKINNNNMQTEIIIKRSEGKFHGAAVNTDFPCCLIERDEVLNIQFITREKNASIEQKSTEKTSLQQSTEKTSLQHQKLVVLYIRTKGEGKMKIIIKSTTLRTVDYVCVYAFVGETLESALWRDGRFVDEIFVRGSELIEYDDKKKDTVKVNSVGKKQQPGKKHLSSAKKESIEAPAGALAVEPNVHQSQYPVNTEQKETQKAKMIKSTNQSGAQVTGDLENTEYKILCKDILEKLKDPEVRKLYQKEFDKGFKSFTEVTKVKQLMILSDSVCLIGVEPSKDEQIAGEQIAGEQIAELRLSPSEHQHTFSLLRPIKVAFNYEYSKSQAIVLRCKNDLAAYRYEKDKHIDYALLELDIDESISVNCSQLLRNYKHAPPNAPPNSGGIYIVGHPDCGVKKMDPCFIIEIENRLQAINNHISQNRLYPYVSLQCWPYLKENDITYDTCFFHGSSGSPVFDEYCYLIGMHTGGFDYKEGDITRSVIEFAYSMQSILESLKNEVKTKRPDILNLLSEFEFMKELPEETEGARGANMPMEEQFQNQEDVKMEID